MDEKIVDSTLRQLAHKKRTVKDLISFLSNKCEETSNYTLLIGAGCSVTSGIDSGGDLIKKWKKEIYESENTEGVSEDDFWKSQYEWYDSRNPYSSLFQKKYDLPRQRRIFVEKQVAKKDPSIGYAYLVKLIEERYFNTVFTTNFDDLLNEAFYRFSPERPIVCAHDSSISSITITSSRPKIIKLHGDYLFDDIKSSLRETESLDDNMKRKFIEFAKDHGLVVVGYAGNDRSVMDILSMLLQSNEYFKHGIYWCIREDETNLSDDLRHLLWKDRVYYVPIKGFDELMSTLNHSLTGQLPINRKMLSSEHHKELIGKLTNNKYIKSLQENPFIKKDIDDLNKIVNSNIVSDFFKYISIKKVDDDEPKRKSKLRKLSGQERDVLAELNALFEEKKCEELLQKIDEKYKEGKGETQYACRLLELKAKTLRSFFFDKKEELRNTYLELINLDSKQEGYYLDAFYAMEEHDSKMFFLDKAINEFSSDFYLYNQKARYLLDYARDMCFADNYSNLLDDIRTCISKSLELNSSPENDALIRMISFIILKENDYDKVRQEIKEFFDTHVKKGTVLYGQVVSKYYSYLSMDENKAIQILKELCVLYREADAPLKYEKCLLALLSLYEDNGNKEDYRREVDEYKKEFIPSITFEHFVMDDRVAFFGDVDEVEKEVLAKLEKLSDINEKIYYRKFLFKLYCNTNNKAKIKDAFEKLNNPTLEDKIGYNETIEDYDAVLSLLDNHWKDNPVTLDQICTYSYCLLQKKDYQRAYFFLSHYYSKPEYADGVIYINYFMAEMHYQKKNIAEMKEKINNKIFRYKDRFSKRVLISAHALLNEKNDMLRCIRQLKKSEALLKYSLVKWPVLKSYLNDSDFRSALGLD